MKFKYLLKINVKKNFFETYYIKSFISLTPQTLMILKVFMYKKNLIFI